MYASRGLVVPRLQDPRHLLTRRKQAKCIELFKSIQREINVLKDRINDLEQRLCIDSRDDGTTIEVEPSRVEKSF